MPLLLPLTRQPSAAFLLCRYFTKNRDKTTDKAAKKSLVFNVGTFGTFVPF
ncbi:hypothetical protein [Eikenella halliae]|uniref:hypothetical protein n=1 Tax=Eikenella halliae TaxID=1795832 RepID=UPI0012E7B5F2|nr:hypothetical protein [Eikenella halliae]